MGAPDSLASGLCRECQQPLSAGALACSHCRALVHGEELARLSAQAKRLEAERRLHEARELWVQARLLLPIHSKQSDWIKQHANELERTAAAAGIPEPENKWASRLGPVGPIAIVLAKSKVLLGAVFKLKFLLSFAAFLGV